MLRPLLFGCLAAATLSAGAAAADAPAPGTPARMEPGRISTPANEYNFNSTADGSLAVFARSEAGFANARIMVMERAGDGWSEPRPIAFSDPRWKDSDPWLTPDGGTLYFASTRPTPARPDKKDTDLWRSRRTADGWSAPEHLGDMVNTPGMELGPEVHGGVLYFNSTRPGGPGPLNIWRARLVEGGIEAPELLPDPINSAAQEGDFTLSPDGRWAYFWSTRDGRGRLYRAEQRADGWGPAEVLPDAVNEGDFQFTPQLSADGRTLHYAGTAAVEGQPAGMADLYSVRLP